MDASKFVEIHRKQGLILDEFQIFLDYISQVKPRVGKKSFQLSSPSLLDLNKRLNNSLKLDLRKPQPRSYPHINALYFLFHVSGLASYSFEGNNVYLKLDSIALKKWKELSDTNKYFNLLTAWLGNGKPEIIAEERNHQEANSALLFFYFSTLKNGEKGTVIELNKLERIKTELGLYQVALLQMFGLILIEDQNQQISKQWNIKRIVTTDNGKHILDSFSDYNLYTDYKSIEQFEHGLRLMFKASFNDFNCDLSIVPHQIYETGSLIFRVEFQNLWKRIQFPVHFTGLDICQCIFEAFELNPESSFTLYAKNRFGFYDQYFENDTSDYEKLADDFQISTISPFVSCILMLKAGVFELELFCEEYLSKPIVKERILTIKPIEIQVSKQAKKIEHK